MLCQKKDRESIRIIESAMVCTEGLYDITLKGDRKEEEGSYSIKRVCNNDM
jgi:hypothetical protein